MPTPHGEAEKHVLDKWRLLAPNRVRMVRLKTHALFIVFNK